MVDILKRKLLNPVKYIMAQVFCISCRRDRRRLSGYYSEIQGKHCHYNQYESPLNDIGQIAPCDSNVNDLCHFHGDHNF